METLREHRTVERLPGRSAEYAVGLILLLAASGLFFGYAAFHVVGMFGGG